MYEFQCRGGSGALLVRLFCVSEEPEEKKTAGEGERDLCVELVLGCSRRDELKVGEKGGVPGRLLKFVVDEVWSTGLGTARDCVKDSGSGGERRQRAGRQRGGVALDICILRGRSGGR